MKSIYEKLLKHVTKRNLTIYLGIMGLALIVVLSFGVPNEIGGCGQGDELSTEGERDYDAASDANGENYSSGIAIQPENVKAETSNTADDVIYWTRIFTQNPAISNTIYKKQNDFEFFGGSSGMIWAIKNVPYDNTSLGYDQGPYYSNDDGYSWSLVSKSGLGSRYIVKMAVAPNGTLYAITKENNIATRYLQFSTDNGSTWSDAFTDSSGGLSLISCDKASECFAYAGIGAIYHGSGSNWSALTLTGQQLFEAAGCAPRTDLNLPNNLFAADNSTFLLLSSSSNNAYLSWLGRNVNGSYSDCYQYHEVNNINSPTISDRYNSIHASNANNIWAAGKNYLFHFDGTNWNNESGPYPEAWILNKLGQYIIADSSSRLMLMIDGTDYNSSTHTVIYRKQDDSWIMERNTQNEKAHQFFRTQCGSLYVITHDNWTGQYASTMNRVNLYRRYGGEGEIEGCDSVVENNPNILVSPEKGKKLYLSWAKNKKGKKYVKCLPKEIKYNVTNTGIGDLALEIKTPDILIAGASEPAHEVIASATPGSHKYMLGANKTAEVKVVCNPFKLEESEILPNVDADVEFINLTNGQGNTKRTIKTIAKQKSGK